MKSKTIKISSENYRWLARLAAEYQKQKERPVSLDEALTEIKMKKSNKKKLLSFAGIWDNKSDEEIEELKIKFKKGMEFMENKICLDSDFLIDFLRNKETAVDWVKENSDFEFATTIITAFELYYGEYKNKQKSNVQRLENLLQTITLLNLSEPIVKKAGQITATLESEGLMIEFKDVLIATTAIINNYKLKTLNKKHFERMKQFGLQLI